jgi:hypothetical protein
MRYSFWEVFTDELELELNFEGRKNLKSREGMALF